MTDHDQDQDTDQGLERAMGAARRAGPQWNAGRQQQIKWALMARLDSLSRRRGWFSMRLVAITGTCAVAATVLIAVSGFNTGNAPPAERLLPKLADGSSIVLDGPTANLQKTVETAKEVTFQLESGGAHFEVARRPARIFRVHAGPVTVQVIGTRFHVQRQQARSRISVDRGRVLVSWWGGSRELGAGEQGIFPPDGLAERPPTAPLPPAPTTVVTGAGTTAESTAASPGQSEGFRRFGASSRTSERSAPLLGPDVLFSRADRARAHGKPELALANLREILDRYPSDPHAPMAAFTAGRLLLESLRQPRQAALAFAQARALAKAGPLAEDALAREVEALHAAGDASSARRRAEQYLKLFPRGPRVKAVRRLGGVQATP